MFAFAYDIVEAAAVFLFTGSSNDDEDYVRYIAAFQQLDRKANGREAPLGFIVVDEGSPLPNALWRKRIAEASAGLTSNPLVIVVSESMLARGVVQAMQWVRPLPFKALTAARFEDAIDLAEQRRGRRLRGLVALHVEARSSAATRARAAAQAG